MVQLQGKSGSQEENIVVQRGVELYQQGNYRESIEYFSSLDSNMSSVILYYLGLCHAKLGNQEDALQYLNEFINNSEDFTQIYQARMLIGYLYSDSEKYRLAEFEFQRLLDEGYESSKVRAALGFIHFKQGNIPSSIQNLEQARSLDPKNTTALNSLAFILANERIQIPLALKYIKQALRLSPRNPVYLDTLGWILHKNGEAEKAIQVIQKALDLAPDRKEIQEHFELITAGQEQ